MPIGAGKYDDLCTYVRENSDADGAIVIVLNGKLGNGFSVQAIAEITATLPVLLRSMAEQIESLGGRT